VRKYLSLHVLNATPLPRAHERRRVNWPIVVAAEAILLGLIIVGIL
jgi:hypothetical protein